MNTTYPETVFELLALVDSKGELPVSELPERLRLALDVCLGSPELVETKYRLSFETGTHVRGWKLSQEGKAVLARHRLQGTQATAVITTPTAEPPHVAVAEATPNVLEPSEDFRSMNWNGTLYEFTPTQSRCLEVLYKAWQSRSPVIGQDLILERADSNSEKLRDVFDKGKHPAWGTLIVSPGKGLFRLVEQK